MTAPDYIEPIVGFRAWHADGGDLVPWSAGRAGAWQPGVNEAKCLHRPPSPNHRAPVGECSCGLYALASATDARLHPGSEAVGAIAAWGDVEVHRTGFRAQYAAVVALALPGWCEARHADALRAAAARYRVPLVPVGGLVAVALEHGRPVGFDAIVTPPPETIDTRPPPPALTERGACGIAFDDHVTVTVAAEGVRLRPTAALREAVGGPRDVRLPATGQPVCRSDVLVHVGGDDGLVIRTPLSGCVIATDGWDVTIRPSNWNDEARDVAWGRAARRGYAAILADAASRGDAFTDLRTRWVHAHAAVRSAADVAAVLRAERATPRFATEDDVYTHVGARLRAALADPAVARAAARAPLRIAWRLHDPDSDLMLDCATGRPIARSGDTSPADITLFASAETADAYFAGRVDLAAALRRREIQSSAPRESVLRLASVLKPLHTSYGASHSSPGRRRDMWRLGEQS